MARAYQNFIILVAQKTKRYSAFYLLMIVVVFTQLFKWTQIVIK